MDFEDRLGSRGRQAGRQAEETAGTLDELGQAELKAMRQKRDTLAGRERNTT